MKAILIDPVAKTVSEVEHNGDYHQIYEFLSDKDHKMDVHLFECVNIDGVNSIYVDEEGLLHNPKYFFSWRGYPQPLSGRGLILGCNDEGDSIGTTLTKKEVETLVKFGQLSVQGFRTVEKTIDHPLLGPNTPFIGSHPIFGPPNEDDE